jgi:predicted amidohydrolase YtcJ
VQANIVFLDGDIRTMDGDNPQVSALAIRGERIVALGSDVEVRKWIGPTTKVIELEGRSVTPGLSDAHCHLYGLGKSLESVNLRSVASADAAAALVAEAAKNVAKGEWVVGRGWDQNRWAVKEFPSRTTLDAVVRDQPVSLRRVDGHALWANSMALTLAGIDDQTADPPGGKIVRDAEGKATGVLIDTAMGLVESKIPKADMKAIKRRILQAAKVAASHGLTSVHEMGLAEEVIRAYRALAHEGRLPLRVYGFVSGSPEVAHSLLNRVPEVDREGTQYFVLRGIKMFVDGALGSRGAVMLEDYSDDKGNKGLWLTSAKDLERAAIDAAQAGWQVGVHAIGDAGNRAVLDAFEAAYLAVPDSDLRFRVEHAQIISPEDLPRFAALNVIASMQPTHATSDMPWAEDRVGADRLVGAYAWRTLIDSGAHLAAGSDFPVEKVPPLLGLYAAVTRQDAKGSPEGGWLPEQRMTLDQALAAFTVESAYASFSETNRGMLKKGYVADLTVFDRALQADKSLLETGVDMTIVGGAFKYEAK